MTAKPGLDREPPTAAPGPPYRRTLAALLSRSGGFHVLQRIAARLYGGFILAFHDLPASSFTEIIEALRPNQPVSLSELVNRVNHGKTTAGLFAITVDDGVAATVQELVPVLEKHQWPASFYLPTGYLDSDGMYFMWWRKLEIHLPGEPIPLRSGTIDLSGPSARQEFAARILGLMRTRPSETYGPLILELADYLIKEKALHPAAIQPPVAIAWEQVRQLSRGDLIRFESHGMSHCAMSALTEQELDRELRSSRDIITERANRPCRHLCYPFGGTESVGKLAPLLARKYYDSAVTMLRGRIDGRDPFLLPRIPVYARDSGAMARLKVITK